MRLQQLLRHLLRDAVIRDAAVQNHCLHQQLAIPGQRCLHLGFHRRHPAQNHCQNRRRKFPGGRNNDALGSRQPRQFQNRVLRNIPDRAAVRHVHCEPLAPVVFNAVENIQHLLVLSARAVDPLVCNRAALLGQADRLFVNTIAGRDRTLERIRVHAERAAVVSPPWEALGEVFGRVPVHWRGECPEFVVQLPGERRHQFARLPIRSECAIPACAVNAAGALFGHAPAQPRPKILAFIPHIGDPCQVIDAGPSRAHAVVERNIGNPREVPDCVVRAMTQPDRLHGRSFSQRPHDGSERIRVVDEAGLGAQPRRVIRDIHHLRNHPHCARNPSGHHGVADRLEDAVLAWDEDILFPRAAAPDTDRANDFRRTRQNVPPFCRSNDFCRVFRRQHIAPDHLFRCFEDNGIDIDQRDLPRGRVLPFEPVDDDALRKHGAPGADHHQLLFALTGRVPLSRSAHRCLPDRRRHRYCFQEFTTTNRCHFALPVGAITSQPGGYPVDCAHRLGSTAIQRDAQTPRYQPSCPRQKLNCGGGSHKASHRQPGNCGDRPRWINCCAPDALSIVLRSGQLLAQFERQGTLHRDPHVPARRCTSNEAAIGSDSVPAGSRSGGPLRGIQAGVPG